MTASLADTDSLDAAAFRASVALMLRDLSSATLRRLAASWPTERSLAELIVAEAIAAALAERDEGDATAHEVPQCLLHRYGATLPAHAAA